MHLTLALGMMAIAIVVAVVTHYLRFAPYRAMHRLVHDMGVEVREASPNEDPYEVGVKALEIEAESRYVRLCYEIVEAIFPDEDNIPDSGRELYVTLLRAARTPSSGDGLERMCDVVFMSPHYSSMAANRPDLSAELEDRALALIGHLDAIERLRKTV